MRFSRQDWTNPVVLLHLEFISRPSVSSHFVTRALLGIKVWLKWANFILLQLQDVGRCLELNGWVSAGLAFNFNFGSRQSVVVFAEAKGHVVGEVKFARIGKG